MPAPENLLIGLRTSVFVARAFPRHRSRKAWVAQGRPYSHAVQKSAYNAGNQNISIGSTNFPRDERTNIPGSVLKRLDHRLPSREDHPLGILRLAIEEQLPGYKSLSPPSPVVTPRQNFDDLGFAADHPGRSPTDSYYINREVMLRTHTSAHEVETFASGAEKWLMTADVFRRDEIDASHFPVFHQMEGAHVLSASEIGTLRQDCDRLESALASSQISVEDLSTIGASNPYQTSHEPNEAALVVRHLKATLNSVIYGLFRRVPGAEAIAEPLRVRWIDAFFPFTTPSFEVEVMYMGEWLELLGCGVVQQATLERAGVPDKKGWAFGLGLERIAMVLFGIPDIRLFWSEDPRFANQFKDRRIVPFRPFSKNPPCYKDVSFWVPEAGFHENDLCEVIRDAGGLLVEEVKLIDDFVHPKTQRQSKCYRVNYRSMDSTLSNLEVNALQKRVEMALVEEMRLELR